MKYRQYAKGLTGMLLCFGLWSCNLATFEEVLLDVSSGSDLECGHHSKCDALDQCIANRCVSVSQASMPITLRFSRPDGLHAPMVLETDFVPGQSLGVFSQPDLVDTAVRVQYQHAFIGGVADFSMQSKYASLIGSQSLGLSSDGNEKTSSKVALMPGVYDITVFPTQTAAQTLYPTMFFSDVEIGSHGDLLTLNLDQKVLLDNRQEQYWMTTATGVIDAKGSYDVDIRLQDRDSPASTARIPICSEGVCSPSFEALLPPQKYDVLRCYDVIASIKALPTVVISEKLGQFEASSKITQPMRGNLVIPPVKIKTFELSTIQGQIVSSIGKSTGNATVILTATSADGSRKWTSTAHEPSDAEGYFRIDIPHYVKDNDFQYLVSLVFEASNPHATEYFPYVLDDASLMELRAKPKYRYNGVVTALDGKQSVEGASIIAKPLGQYGHNEVIGTVSDSTGSFSLALDAIAYSVSIVPPKRMGLPTYIDSFSPEGGDVFNDVVLKKADLIYGTCVNTHGAVVQDVRVEAFVDNLKMSSFVRIASSISDNEGVFRLFVPALDEK